MIDAGRPVRSPSRPLWRLLRLVWLPGELLRGHARACGELAAAEFVQAWSLWRTRWLLRIAGLLCGVGALGLAGVALMLWAAVPPAQVHAPWVLWVVPSAMGAIALACLWAARGTRGPAPFAGLRRQLRADVDWLQGREPRAKKNAGLGPAFANGGAARTPPAVKPPEC